MHFSKSEIVTGAVISVIVLLVGAYAIFLQFNNDTDASSKAEQALEGADGAADFTDLNGNPVSLAAYGNAIRVVNSWASWTPFSRQELIDLESVAAEYEGQTDIVFIAINRKEQNATARAYLGQIGPFSHIVFVQDPDDSFYATTGGFSMPETVIYSQNGNELAHVRGSMSREEIKRVVEEALTATSD